MNNKNYNNNNSKFYHHTTQQQKKSTAFSKFNSKSNFANFAKNNNFIPNSSELFNLHQTPTEQYPKGLSVRRALGTAASIFPFTKFNPVQTESFDLAFSSGDNLLISAPTASGKTVIMELAILRQVLLSRNEFENIHNLSSVSTPIPQFNSSQYRPKAVYFGPIKTLCQQIATHWSNLFSVYGVRVTEITGDVETDYRILPSTEIIITTPEKWDSVTRKWTDHTQLMESISLILIDEVHLLNDEKRGPILEAVLSRMKTIGRSLETKIRIVAISATLPNVHDVACWLEIPSESVKQFGDEYRPVQLELEVLGFKSAQNDFMFELNLTYKLYDLICRNYEAKPVLIFVSTRKSAEKTAKALVGQDQANLFILSEERKQNLFSLSQKLENQNLAQNVLNGVGFHSAANSLKDRKMIEEAYLNGTLLILVTTTTLSQGVNFPAHLVIVKGTKMFTEGSTHEYSEFTLLQMIGRAGRPQFDTDAKAIIMTELFNREKYTDLLTLKKKVESHLINSLVEHLNAEIALEYITNVSIAIEWLQSTYLFARMKTNPEAYNLKKKDTNPENLTQILSQMIKKNLKHLQELGLIILTNDDYDIEPTPLGKVMANYCLSLDTMGTFLQLPKTSTMSDIFGALTSLKELSQELHLRANEKKILKEISEKNDLRWPLEENRITLTSQKINILLQCSLGDIDIPEHGLNRELIGILNTIGRSIKAIQSIFKFRKFGSALQNSIILGKCLENKMWEDSKLISKQIPGIGISFARSLSLGGITTLSILSETPPWKIEMICGRKPPFGSNVIEAAQKLPFYTFKAEQLPSKKNTELIVEVSVVKKNPNSPNQDSNFSNLLAFDENGSLWFSRRFISTTFSFTSKIKITVSEFDTKSNSLIVVILNDRYLGLDCSAKLENLLSNDEQGEDVEFPIVNSSLIKSTPRVHTFLNEGMKKKKKKSDKICKHNCKDKASCKHECCKSEEALKKRKLELNQKPLKQLGMSSFLKKKPDIDLVDFNPEDIAEINTSKTTQSKLNNRKGTLSKNTLSNISSSDETLGSQAKADVPKRNLKIFNSKSELVQEFQKIRKSPRPLKLSSKLLNSQKNSSPQNLNSSKMLSRLPKLNSISFPNTGFPSSKNNTSFKSNPPISKKYLPPSKNTNLSKSNLLQEKKNFNQKKQEQDSNQKVNYFQKQNISLRKSPSATVPNLDDFKDQKEKNFTLPQPLKSSKNLSFTQNSPSIPSILFPVKNPKPFTYSPFGKKPDDLSETQIQSKPNNSTFLSDSRNFRYSTHLSHMQNSAKSPTQVPSNDIRDDELNNFFLDSLL